MTRTLAGETETIDAGGRTSRAEALARRLEQEILAGLIAPGERLGTKPELKVRFGVAVATMNEAMRMLEMRGLIEVRPGVGGGVFARAPSGRVRLANYILSFKEASATAADCLMLRNTLEPALCRDAASHARAKDIRELKELLERMALVVDRPTEYLRWNWSLHRRIAAICKNVPLQLFYVALLDLVEQDLEAIDHGWGSIERNLELHRRLVDAIANDDEPEIDRVLELHVPFADQLSLAGRRRTRS